jgi:SAM-dependent methyltransferase
MSRTLLRQWPAEAAKFFAEHWPLKSAPPTANQNSPEADLHARRAEIAQQYIQGTGIEFGALHAPLAVPPGVTVTYADHAPAASLATSYAEVGPLRPPQIMTDLESMRGIADESQDFIIANHVLEHVEDPLRALGSIGRVLRSGGIAFLAVPDKRFTFDREREITPLAHVIRDRDEGPDWSLTAHYEEWSRCIDRLDGAAQTAKISLMIKQRANIHFHVWDYPAMMELFSYVARQDELPFDIEMSMLNVIEVIWILRKR